MKSRGVRAAATRMTHGRRPTKATYEGDLDWPEDDEDAEYEEPDETD